MKCPKCNGTSGITKISDTKYNIESCSFCHFKKDLDWIEIIIGVDHNHGMKKLKEELANYKNEMSKV